MYEAIIWKVFEHIGQDENIAEVVFHITSMDINNIDFDSVWEEEMLKTL